jgi:ATP-dependent RNA circularization protein (DNA/RNA ligase family)
MTDFFRFPRTPHLTWLGEGEPRDDKVLSPEDASDFLSADVVVEEKVDGANLGFSVNGEGALQAQNRGSYLTRDFCHEQFSPLWRWLAPRESLLMNALWPDLMLFGEWCVAVHSVEYDRLPDWFLGFDIYDRSQSRFWGTERRDALLTELGLHSVPRLATGRFTPEDLASILDGSRVGSGPMEGLVIRQESDGWTTGRAKLVRATFAQSIEEHWSRGPLRRNSLARHAWRWR